MITGIVSFRLRPGIDRATALAEIAAMVPMYQAQAALVRKAIHLDLAAGTGRSIYLWRERAAAEAFYAMAKVKIAEQTGFAPEVELIEVDVLVDNDTGEVFTRP